MFMTITSTCIVKFGRQLPLKAGLATAYHHLVSLEHAGNCHTGFLADDQKEDETGPAGSGSSLQLSTTSHSIAKTSSLSKRVTWLNVFTWLNFLTCSGKSMTRLKYAFIVACYWPIVNWHVADKLDIA